MFGVRWFGTWFNLGTIIQASMRSDLPRAFSMHGQGGVLTIDSSSMAHGVHASSRFCTFEALPSQQGRVFDCVCRHFWFLKAR